MATHLLIKIKYPTQQEPRRRKKTTCDDCVSESSPENKTKEEKHWSHRIVPKDICQSPTKLGSTGDYSL